MTTINLIDNLASITDKVSGGSSYEITLPNSAAKRNLALREAMILLLEKEKDLKQCREAIRVMLKEDNKL